MRGVCYQHSMQRTVQLSLPTGVIDATTHHVSWYYYLIDMPYCQLASFLRFVGRLLVDLHYSVVGQKGHLMLMTRKSRPPITPSYSNV